MSITFVYAWPCLQEENVRRLIVVFCDLCIHRPNEDVLKKEAAEAIRKFLLLHPNCQKDLRNSWRNLQSKYTLLSDPYHTHDNPLLLGTEYNWLYHQEDKEQNLQRPKTTTTNVKPSSASLGRKRCLLAYKRYAGSWRPIWWTYIFSGELRWIYFYQLRPKSHEQSMPHTILRTEPQTFKLLELLQNKPNFNLLIW